MKVRNSIFFSASMLAAFGLLACHENATPEPCELNEDVCKILGKIFDKDSCACNENTNPKTCELNEDACKIQGKIFDKDSCACNENTNPKTCELNEDACKIQGKIFDKDSCTCNENVNPEPCELNEDACKIQGKIFDKDSCTCNEPTTPQCPENQHVFEDSCEPDSLDHCGDHDNACASSITGWGTGNCTNGACVISTCADKFHFFSNICEADNVHTCGSHDIACTAKDGIKSIDCVNGECLIESCSDNFHLYEGNCIADTNTCCGENCDQCEESGKLCSLGSCVLNCQGSQVVCGAECIDTTSHVNHCGHCETDCTANKPSHADEMRCVSSECSIASCEVGFKVVNGQCVSCDDIEGWGNCNNVCVNLYTSNEHCGACGQPCNDDSICSYGTCKPKSEYQYCGEFAVNTSIDSANCSKCGNVCSKEQRCDSRSKCSYFILSSVQDTITCNGKTIFPYYDSDNCGGCGITCNNNEKCLKGQCTEYGFGDLIAFGHYEQDENTSNGPEPIIWRVIDITTIAQHVAKDDTMFTTGGYFLISEKALITKRFNEEKASVSWENSTLRSWLNGYDQNSNKAGIDYSEPTNNFYDLAFSDEEKQKMSVHSYTNTDKVSLLSINDVNNYFKDDADRQADTTPFAQNVSQTSGRFSAHVYSPTTKTSGYRVCPPNELCYSDWWLRNHNTTTESTKSPFIFYSGTINNPNNSMTSDGTSVDVWEITVRPTIWVTL